MKDIKQYDKDRVFRILKKYIILSILSILLVISFVYFFIYRNLEVSRLTEASNSGLLQLSLSCDSLFSSICKLNFQIYNDSDITRLVNGLYVDNMEEFQSSRRLNNYSSTCNNIISIYVYGVRTDCFYSTAAPKQSGADFFDKGAVDIINNIKDMKILYPIPRKITPYGTPDISNNTVNVYTFLYYGLPKFSSSYISQAVMINVSEEWVRESIVSWNNSMSGSICIMDSEGKMVSSLYREQMLQDISQEEFASRILKSGKETGYFICNVSGVKSFVTFVYSDNLEWYFIRVIPYGIIYGNLKKIGLITLLLLILYITAGFVLSYKITGKAQKSIDDIISTLKRQINDNMSDLDKLRQEFLLNSLNNNIPASPEQIQKDFHKYGILLLTDDMLLILLLKIDHYSELCERFKSYDITLLKQAVINTASRIFLTKYLVEAVNMKEDHVVLLFNVSGPDSTDISQIDDMIKLVQDSVEKEVKLSVSAVLSPSGYNFNDINLLYTEVRQASNYRLFYGHRCIIHSEELKTLGAQEYSYPAEKEKMLLDALMLGRVEPAGKLLDDILNSTKGYQYTVLNSHLLRLTSFIGSAFQGIESIGKYSIDYDFNSFVASLNSSETLEDIKNKFSEMFHNVFSILAQQRNSKYGLLVNKAIDIINQDYSDSTLCLNAMAAKLDISPGYLGKLFKTYTSKSINDYINKIRVEKALGLLEECGMSINDVALKVGFSSKSYFHTIFKRVVGVTPSEYRQKIKIK